VSGDELTQRTGVDDAGDAKGAPEGPPPLRLRETGRVGVDMRTPAVSSTLRVGYYVEHRRTGIPARRVRGEPVLGAADRDDP
jgi:hypothetical protein